MILAKRTYLTSCLPSSSIPPDQVHKELYCSSRHHQTSPNASSSPVQQTSSNYTSMTYGTALTGISSNHSSRASNLQTSPQPAPSSPNSNRKPHHHRTSAMSNRNHHH